MDAEFCLLGPLQVRCGGEVVRVPAGKQRAVLAALLLQANRVVTADELVDVMWGATPPATARAGLHNCVKRLRDSLGAARDRITTEPGGYMICLRDGELDVARFEARLDGARAAARGASWDAAARQAREALSLWRGQPLADVASEALAVREAGRLAGLRLQAAETYSGAMLSLGQHGEVIEELRQLVTDAPLRERFHALLMTALYRDGRQAEALAAFQHARTVLVEEVGAEPGPELQELQQRILAADPALAGPKEPAPARQAPGQVVPRELPAPVPHFTGRAAELDELSDLTAGGAVPALVICAVGGTAGVGKTALALHWAHQVVDRFPDGQLYVDLRGYDRDLPMPAGDALARLLRSLGVPGRDIPAEEAERAARYRSMLAGKRMLVILDNVGSVEQARPLLPGSTSCTVVVTSRDALPGLVARDGAKRLGLDLLPLHDAVGLLRALIGTPVDHAPEAAARLALQCCRLPLALRVAAELAASRPAVPLAELSAELADQQQRLDLLDPGGDSRTAVRAVFSWSYRNLDAATARTFCLLSLHPGPDFEPYAAAALTSQTLGQARRAIDLLARAHLVQPAGHGRYAMHDLLRAYARELAAGQGSEQDRQAALTRLFDHYLHAAITMTGIMIPAERRQPHGAVPPPTALPPVTDPAGARAYLDTERPSLAAAVAYTAEHGHASHAIRLAETLDPYLEIEYIYEAVTIHGHALRAARAIGDRSAEAEALASLGGLDFWQGRQQRAAERLHRARALLRETGDWRAEARVLADLGIVGLQQGRYQEAAGHLQEALVLHRRAGDRPAEARVLSNLGRAAQRLGDYPQAATRYNQALAMSREAGDNIGEAYTLLRLSGIDLHEDHNRQAVARLERALSLFRVIRHRAGEAQTLSALGEARLRQGLHRQATDSFQQALTLFEKMGDLADQAEALNGLGEAMLADGDPGQARSYFGRALDLARQAEVPYDQARAHNGLGQAHCAAGDREQARQHWQYALALFGELGSPEAEEVREKLWED